MMRSDTPSVEPAGVRPLRLVIAIQGFSYLVTGLWPLVHYSSFVALAGPKPDRYQFLATVFLVLAIALALLVGSLPIRKPEPVGRGLYTLAVATPAAFGLLYLWAVAAGEALPAVYWVDLGFELVFLVLLVWLGLRRRVRVRAATARGSVDREDLVDTSAPHP